MTIEERLPQVAIEIHADNVKVGWWTNLKTGESTLHTRNRPEMLMLAISEIAEAAEGNYGKMDDKLPHLPMYDVEIADFVIRQFDQIGAEVSCGHHMPTWGDSFCHDFYVKALRPMSRDERLMELVTYVSKAMEHYRKGRIQNYIEAMGVGIRTAFAIAEVEHIDLWDIIEQKRQFNASRSDHKIENRLKEGGKAF